MTLPVTVNTTYAPLAPVLSADLNAIQNSIVLLHPYAYALPFASFPAFANTSIAGEMMALGAADQQVYSNAEVYGSRAFRIANTSVGLGGPGGSAVQLLGPGVRGVWRFCVDVILTIDSATNPSQLFATLMQHDTAGDADTGTELKTWLAERYNTNAAQLVHLKGEHSVFYDSTTAPGPRFSVRLGAAATVSGGYFYVEQTRRLPAP